MGLISTLATIKKKRITGRRGKKGYPRISQDMTGDIRMLDVQIALC